MRRLFATAIAVAALACSPIQDGPTPRIASPGAASPAVVCPACTEATLRRFTVTGTGFAPAVEGVADETPSAVLPEILLVNPAGERTQVPRSAIAFAEAADGADVLEVELPHGAIPPLAAGEAEVLYGVRVANPNGNAGFAGAALRAVPPDAIFSITGVDPPFGWTAAPTAVTIASSGAFASTPTAFIAPHGVAGAAPTPLENVAFIDASTLSAVVPAGLPIGPYDLAVVNPGAPTRIGSLDGGFRIVANPVPRVASVVPSRGTSQEDTAVTIAGDAFRDTVRVELLDAAGTVAFEASGVSPVDAGRIDTVFPTKSAAADLPAGAYLVRVTDEDEGTYSTYSAFLVTNPAGNLSPFEAAGSMAQARRMLAGAFGRDVLGNAYLYAAGGDFGEGTAPLDTVEVSALSKYGALGTFRIQANRLQRGRAGGTAIAVPVTDEEISPFVPVRTYLYVIGGATGAGEATATVERAAVLDPADAPLGVAASGEVGAGSLAAGTWYYEVAAVLSADDPDDPGGETLPSEEAVVALPAAGAVALSWEPVAVNGLPAAAYRVYRTDAPDGVSKTEHLIAEVAGTAYADGGDAAGASSPQFLGATGAFVEVGSALGTARIGFRVVVARDETGARFAIALGGADGETFAPVDTVEIAAIGDDGSLGDFTAIGATALDAPRAFFDAVVEDTADVSTYAGAGSRIWVLGGIDAAGDVTGSFASSDVAGGGIGAWTVNDKSVQAAAGAMAVIANDKLFCLGGAGASDGLSFSSVTANGRDAEFDAAGDVTGSVNSTANSLLAPRAFGAAVEGAGFIYLLGGTSDGADALATVERTY
jgi:hypothetical protein